LPKLDPDDIQQPTSADVAAAQSAPATAPRLFGGTVNATATTNVPPSGASAFGSPSSNGGFAPTNNGFGASGGGFGSTSGGYGSPVVNNGNNTNVFVQRPQTASSIAPDANTTAAFGNAMAASEGQEPEHWMKAFWRPAMGWLYMLICFMDFVAFPMISMFLPIIERGFGVQVGYTAWQSLTLSNGGLIHLAFGGILGISAFGRTKEKEAGVSK
jgi:hypothetical protein